MALKIRGFAPDDKAILYDICLQTGAAGRDATALFSHHNLLGDIYAGPYMRLAPELVFVVEDDEGVAGYVLGTLDSETWVEKLEQEWWPPLRETYPSEDGGLSDLKPADWESIALIHQPHATPAEIVARYPAHVHLNLLPRLQGKGVGKSMLRRWFKIALDHGVRSVHLGVSAHNRGGIAFWQKQGFEPLTIALPDPDTIWMGQDLD